MENKTILFEISDDVAVIMLKRPESMNAVNLEMIGEIEAAVDYVTSKNMARAMVLTGGEKVFAAGFDIKEIATTATPAAAHELLRAINRCYNKLEAMRIPVIAAVSGLTFGGGFEMALACDIRIASDTARFALPEINLGLIPGAGGTQRLPRLIGMGRALEMLFSGSPITAAKALEIGLVNLVTTPDKLIDKAMEMARQLASKPAHALNMLKQTVHTGMNTNLASALENEARCFELLFSTHDQKEGIAAFLEKRKPVFNTNEN